MYSCRKDNSWIIFIFWVNWYSCNFLVLGAEMIWSWKALQIIRYRICMKIPSYTCSSSARWINSTWTSILAPEVQKKRWPTPGAYVWHVWLWTCKWRIDLVMKQVGQLMHDKSVVERYVRPNKGVNHANTWKLFGRMILI